MYKNVYNINISIKIDSIVDCIAIYIYTRSYQFEYRFVEYSIKYVMYNTNILKINVL